MHVTGPDLHDLVTMAVTETEGFRPRATAVVLNEAHGQRPRFDQVLQHPAFQAAVERGAVPLWMPCLKAGPFTASAVQTWLRKMGEEMAPIASWIPE